jgi:hypothetical protein
MTAADRQQCRNIHCRSKLPAPVGNAHHAFCTPRCHSIFYRSRCLVCEEPMQRKSEQQKFKSGHSTCRREYRHFPHVYVPCCPNRHGDTAGSMSPLGNAHFKGVKSALEGERAWRVIAGPPLSSRSLALATLGDERVSRRVRGGGNIAGCLIGPKTWPVVNAKDLRRLLSGDNTAMPVKGEAREE